MIIEIIAYMFLEVFSLVSSIFPGTAGTGGSVVLPFGIDNALVVAVGVWTGFMETFPYAVVGWNLLLYFILPFEFIMLIAKMVLGSRTPIHSAN